MYVDLVGFEKIKTLFVEEMMVTPDERLRQAMAANVYTTIRTRIRS